MLVLAVDTPVALVASSSVDVELSRVERIAVACGNRSGERTSETIRS
jgi:hypothetical protein